MKKYKIVFIIIAFIITVALTAFITTIIVKNKSEVKDEKTNTYLNNKTTNIEDKKNVYVEESKDVDREEVIISNNEDKSDVKSVVIEENKEDVSAKIDNNIIESEITNTEKTEEDVINYVENISANNGDNKLKEGFISVIDFLFYDGKIHNKTFKELSNSAKLKVISLAFKIDEKIDEHYPNYKETLSNKYKNIKNELISLYLDTTVKICSNNKTLCDDAKKDLKELKKSFGITWDFIKDISGIGVTKLKDWYEVWKEE